MFGNNKQLEFQLMMLQRDIDDLKRSNEELKSENEKLKTELEEKIKEIKVPNVEKEGRSWFANKLVERMVYATAGTILMAAVATFVGGVPWLG